MEVTKTKLDGVVVIEPKLFGDDRGYFFESFSEKEFKEKVCNTTFVQDNESYSKKGVIRGLHYQCGEHAQSKLVRCVRGTVLDVAVDIREGSPTFGEYVAVVLSENNHRQLFIPRGFAHGFMVLSDEATFQYKCDNFYNKDSERGIKWNDPAIGIEWGPMLMEGISLSEKDMENPLLCDAKDLFQYGVDYYKKKEEIELYYGC